LPGSKNMTDFSHEWPTAKRGCPQA
jgi:hypothetical protein